MVKLELDTDRIDTRLTELDRNRAWLGRQVGVSNAVMHYIWKTRSAIRADQISEAVNLPLDQIVKHTEV